VETVVMTSTKKVARDRAANITGITETAEMTFRPAVT
jgi:hypothetical protein